MSEAREIPITHLTDLTDSTSRPPCIVHEDDHLLVVNKPAVWNTHAPSPFAGEGIYDWLKHREPRWAMLAIIHRLDKETSGMMVFGKTPEANRSLTAQFEQREVRKKYLLLTDRIPKHRDFLVKTRIARVGERYASGAHGESAETKFTVLTPEADRVGARRAVPEAGAPIVIAAEPLTGRTHQIRVHAAESGFPILGDRLYGGSEFPRVCLHAAELQLRHPVSGVSMSFSAAADFFGDAGLAFRKAIIAPEVTDAFRLIHGASDGWPGWHVDRLGPFLLSQGEQDLTAAQGQKLRELQELFSLRGVYHKKLTRQFRRTSSAEASAQLVLGDVAPDHFTIRENEVKYEASFAEGYSMGLFLDQRDNRRHLLTSHVAADFPLRGARSAFRVLNTFAYTCGFSVCAALAGAHTTSLDLSKKYLEWGRRNFALNGIDPAEHDFIFGDAFDWLKRLARKGRKFDLVIIDPPTFSQSKQSGAFRVEKDYGKVVTAALQVLEPDGILFCSTNAAEWKPEKFLATVERAMVGSGRKIARCHYVPQPPDFPVSRADPAYLKTAWFRLKLA